MRLFDIFRGQSLGVYEPTYTELIEQGDFAAAMPRLRNAIKKDDREAMGVLASLLALGRGVERNLEDAALWYRQAAVRGHVASQAALGFCLASGTGGRTDFQEAAHWFYKAARAGHRKAAIGLGNLIFQDRTLLDLGLFSAREVNDLVLAARQSGNAGTGS